MTSSRGLREWSRLQPAVECYRRWQTSPTVTSLAPYTMCIWASNNGFSSTLAPGGNSDRHVYCQSFHHSFIPLTPPPWISPSEVYFPGWLIELRFYILHLNTEWVISEMFFPANILAWYWRKKLNITKASNTWIKLSMLTHKRMNLNNHTKWI